MISKLPKWVWAGGFVLAFVAGMVNVVALLGMEHQAVSHLTGPISRLGVAVVERDTTLMPAIFGIVLSFLAGAVISGWLIQTSALQVGRHYGQALLFESFLLTAAVVLLGRGSGWGVLLLCGACGMQNAMASTYSGAIVRTTHMTGIMTDLGILCGQALRGLSIDWRRLLLCVALIGGFFVGGAVGALVYPLLGYRTILIPAGITGSAAVGYMMFDSLTRRAAASSSSVDRARIPNL